MPRAALIVGIASLMVLVGIGARAEGYRPPRGAFGYPDLAGIWSSNSTTKLERPSVYPSLVITPAQARAIPPPPAFGDDDVGQEETEAHDPGWALARVGRQIRTSWVVDPPDGRLPYTEAGRKLVQGPFLSDGPETRPTNDRCLPFMSAGPPMLNAGGSNLWQILQTRDHVVFEMEGNHEIRIVRLTEKGALPPGGPAQWLGRSAAWYEGDTLVVRTTGFHALQSLRRFSFARLYLSSDALVTERFRRISPRQILYVFEVHDPAIFSRDWRAEMPLTASRGPIYESGCQEGNYSMAGILGGARVEEQAVAAPR
jgi:hypothetical protein